MLQMAQAILFRKSEYLATGAAFGLTGSRVVTTHGNARVDM